MHKHILSFQAFLVVYLGFLVYHTIQIPFVSWFQILTLVIGFILALIAHSRQGYATILFLLLHMIIEWSEYAHHSFNYSKKALLFYGVHVLLDIVFLWQELSAHALKLRFTILIGIALILSITALYSYGGHELFYSELTSVLIEMLVIGGMFGCTLSHLFFRKSN